MRLDFSEVKNFSNAEQFRTTFDQYLLDLMTRNRLESPIKTSTEGLRAFKNWLAVQDSDSVVLLIDEYDAPLTVCLSDVELFEAVRMTLAGLYSTIKANDRVLRFFFMTGITKFNKTSIFSELNNLSDLTLEPSCGTLLGYTHEEVEKYFGDYLTRASEVLNIEKPKLMDELTAHYDGFCFERNTKQHVFVPWSLLKFFASPNVGLIDYWFESGGRPTVLIEYLKSHALRNPEEYGKEKSIELKVLSASSDADSISDIGLLTQAGYLTLKKVVDTTAYVGYPNAEVRTSMAQLYLGQILDGKTAEQAGAEKIALVLATGNAETVFHRLNNLFAGIDYNNYPVKDESSVRAYVQVYMAGAGLDPRAEVHGSQGRSDLEVTSGNRLWVFEFKVADKGRKAEAQLQEAINQIVDRDYGNPKGAQELRRA